MYNQELKAHVDLILDMCDKLEGVLIAKSVKGEEVDEKIKERIGLVTDAVLLLGAKVDPWMFNEEDVEFFDAIQERLRKEYEVEE